MRQGSLLVNPLHPNISMYILHTVLHKFLKGLKKRICETVKSSLVTDHFPYSHDLDDLIQGWYCKEKLDASHSEGLKG